MLRLLLLNCRLFYSILKDSCISVDNRFRMKHLFLPVCIYHRRRTPTLIAAMLVLITGTLPLFSQAEPVQPGDYSALPRQMSVEDHLFILGLSRAQAPVLRPEQQQIILTYEPARQSETVGYRNQIQYRSRGPRQVAVAFGHEQYRVLHAMDRSPEGVFFFFFDYEDSLLSEIRTLEYRFVVDGVWINDKNNPHQRRLLSGIQISQVPLPQAPLIPKETPVVSQTGPMSLREVTFLFEAPSGSLVYLSGTFNQWDPYLHRLKEIQPGVFRITLNLRPGTYFYYYVTGGRRIIDPLNPSMGADEEGIALSKLHIPQ